MYKKLVFLIIMTSFSVNAEPSKSVAYLMKEPVTLFDRGLSELGRRIDGSLRLEEYPELVGQINASAKYDWDANEIAIKGAVYQNASTLRTTMPTHLCERVIGRLKNNLGYGENNFVKLGVGGMANYFGHQGFSSKNEPGSLESDLASITKINISVYSSDNNKAPFTKRASCVSDLASSEVYYSDK